VLLIALNTLVIDDRVVPLPSILAEAAIESADAERQNKDKGLPYSKPHKVKRIGPCILDT